MKCPDCNGDKEIVASHVSYANKPHGYNVPMVCTRCSGTGEVPDEMKVWMEVGKLMRDVRVKTWRMNLVDEAKRRGIDTMTLSKMEMGKITPTVDSEMSHSIFVFYGRVVIATFTPTGDASVRPEHR